jgi:hypothetical protein
MSAALQSDVDPEIGETWSPRVGGEHDGIDVEALIASLPPRKRRRSDERDTTVDLRVKDRDLVARFPGRVCAARSRRHATGSDGRNRGGASGRAPVVRNRTDVVAKLQFPV